MGRFCSVLLVLCAACGDNLGGDGVDLGSVEELDTEGVGTATPRFVPAVCNARTWQTGLNAATALDVSVSASSGGAVVLAAPRTGGEHIGLVLDTRMEMVLEKSVAIYDETTRVTTSFLHDRVVSATAHGGAVVLYELAPDLADPQVQAKLFGDVMTEPTFFASFEFAGGHLVPVGAHDGVWLHRLDASYVLQESAKLRATEPVRSLAAAPMGGALLTAWSTDDACYMALSNDHGQGISTHLPVPCYEPRIAIDPQTSRGVMVSESREGMQLASIQPSVFGAPSRLIHHEAKAPRVAFDGTRFWLSHLDQNGDIVVGFLDGDGTPVTMSLAGPRPDARGYELVVVDGAPWVFALTDDGYAAYQMCLDAQD